MFQLAYMTGSSSYPLVRLRAVHTFLPGTYPHSRASEDTTKAKEVMRVVQLSKRQEY